MKPRSTTLPSVLNEYSSGYSGRECNASSSPSHSPQKNSPSLKRKNVVRSQPACRASKDSKAPYRSMTPGERERSARMKREDGERHERVTATWEQARAEVLQERHESLKEKLLLQRQLIQAQDRRAQLLRAQLEEDQQQKRIEERQVKQSREAALQEKFKQSSVKDRLLKGSSKQDDAAESESADGDNVSDYSSPVSGTTDSTGSRRERTRKSGHTGYMPSHDYIPVQSPMKELEDENEEEEVEGRSADIVTPKDLNSVPWHHAQLYKMYGRNAEYYIHPKVQPEKKKVINPTLKSQKGHLGASHIWTTLRTDSKSKLYRTDQRFPQELKDAFSAHVRDGINNKQKPVFRNFTVTEDVPDLDRLMDQSLLRRIRMLRHKTELMYRSSQTNNDRTKVLLFNSPLPCVTEGDEGIDKYLPSWDDASSEVSEASYKKWLALKKPTWEENQEELEDQENVPPLEKRKHPLSVLSPVGSDVSDSLQSIWHAIMARQKPRKDPKYHFLTEEEARSQGAFLEKLGLDKDKLDTGRTDFLPQSQSRSFSRQSLPSIKSMSAVESRNTRRSFADQPASRSESAHNSQHSSSRYQSNWQPLSLNALMEYKEQLATEGAGQFQQGRPKMWNLAATSE